MTEKIPCNRCGASILPSTAQRFHGRCAKCARRLKLGERLVRPTGASLTAFLKAEAPVFLGVTAMCAVVILPLVWFITVVLLDVNFSDQNVAAVIAASLLTIPLIMLSISALEYLQGSHITQLLAPVGPDSAQRTDGGPAKEFEKSHDKFEALYSELLDAMAEPGWQPAAAKIGHKLFAMGQRNHMLLAHALVESSLGEARARELSIVWDRIGGWDGATGGIQLGPDADAIGLQGTQTGKVGEPDGQSWEVLNMAAADAIQNGNNVDAVELLTRAIETQKNLGDTPELASSLTNLAVALDGLEAYQKAQDAYEEALRVADSTHGGDHPQTAAILNLMSQFYFKRGDAERAMALVERAMSIENNLG